MKIELYYAPFSCALVPLVLLKETKVKFEVSPLNIRGKANMTPEYLALNPKHKVPLLVVDDQPLTENIAIQLWIARQFPELNFIPSDPWQQVQAISLLSWFASGIHPHISRYNGPLKFCDAPGSEDNTRRIAGEFLLENFQIADRMLQDRTYFFDDFTAADVYLFWCARRSGFFEGLDLSQFENITAHSNRLLNRPSISEAIEYDDALKANFSLTP